MTVHYHDVGAGEPVLFLHSYGPGTTAWITFHKIIGVLSRHFRCILMDLPNFSKTGPIVYHEGVHAVQARTAVALLDALGIGRAHFVGNSQGGQSSMVAAITYPERVEQVRDGGIAYRHRRRSVPDGQPALGGQSRHARGDGQSYPREHPPVPLACTSTTKPLVTDELVDYIHRAHTWSPAFDEARRQ